MLQQTCLSGKKVDYLLKRSTRRTIGLQINRQGLQVSIPHDLPSAELDALLHRKADWILKKLAAWQNKTPLHSTGLRHDQGIYPLLGNFWQPVVQQCGKIQMVPASNKAESMPSDANLHLTGMPIEQIQKWVEGWYQQQAISCFSERMERYADQLNIPRPPFKLSNAKTRWGSCNSRGMVRLNWRLMQMPLHLVDYVVVHELCHLIEMNHSPAFWVLVESVYPGYQQARQELKGYC